MRIAIKLGLAVLLGTTAFTATAAAQPSAAGIEWRDCGNGLSCGSVAVPADWADPAHSPKTTIGLAKLPARDQTRKLGTLLHNLGGPGPAVEYLPYLKDSYAELAEWFDVVVFDPRGFGTSGGVTCPETGPFLLEWASPGQGAYEGFGRANRTFAQRCADAMGPLRGKLNSWQVAHDMDAIRVALGERKLTYYGNSYGTVFGQAYAGLFGRNVARMYLDSVLDHTDLDPYRWATAKAVVSERNLHRFARWCAQDTSCVLHGRDALAVWDGVIARAEREPIPAPSATIPASAALIRGQARVEDERDWPDFARALAEAEAGDASRFVPPLPPPPGALGPDLSRVMMCADYPYPTGYSAVASVDRRLRGTVGARLGYINAWYPAATHCTGLPRTGTFPPQPIRARGLPPVLITNGEYDNVTPPGHGQRVARQLPGSRYLKTDGGHALYMSGHPYVREHVHRYLVTGQLPAEGTTCAARR